jgi:biopolymer transport protein ExbD
MKRLSSRHLPRLVAEISVTPLLDLMLLLLLTVIVLVPVLQSDSQASTAPADKTAAKPAPQNMIELIADADLKLKLAGENIEHGELITALKKRVAAEPNLGVIVRVPASMTAPRLMEIMEALRAAAILHTAVTISPVLKP